MASASSVFAICRPNEVGNSRRSDSILNFPSAPFEAKAFFGPFGTLSKKPSAAVNIEFYSTLVPHFQEEGLASFLVRNIGSSHDLMNLERLFTQSTQDLGSIIQHAFSLTIAGHGAFTDSTRAHPP
jgi:hypothetical protein